MPRKFVSQTPSESDDEIASTTFHATSRECCRFPQWSLTVWVVVFSAAAMFFVMISSMVCIASWYNNLLNDLSQNEAIYSIGVLTSQIESEINHVVNSMFSSLSALTFLNTAYSHTVVDAALAKKYASSLRPGSSLLSLSLKSQCAPALSNSSIGAAHEAGPAAIVPYNFVSEELHFVAPDAVSVPFLFSVASWLELFSQLAGASLSNTIMQIQDTLVYPFDKSYLTQILPFNVSVVAQQEESCVSCYCYADSVMLPSVATFSPSVSLDALQACSAEWSATNVTLSTFKDVMDVRVQVHTIMRTALSLLPESGYPAVSLVAQASLGETLTNPIWTPFPSISSSWQTSMVFVKKSILLDDFQRILVRQGRPTPQSEVFVAYDGFVLGALTSYTGSLTLSIPVTTPLRTPSGYNCLVDPSISETATCIIQTTTIPLLNDFLSSYSGKKNSGSGAYRDVVDVTLHGAPYVASISQMSSVAAVWQFEVTLYVLSPKDDYIGANLNVTASYIATPVVFVALLLFITALSLWLTASIRDFYKVVVSSVTLLQPSAPGGGDSLPNYSLSLIHEIRAAQIASLFMMKRMTDLSRALQWIRESHDQEDQAITSPAVDAAPQLRAGKRSSPDDRLGRPGDGNGAPSGLGTEQNSDGYSEVSDNTTTSQYNPSTQHLLSTGKANNAFLLFVLVKRSLDPALHISSLVFPTVLKVMHDHRAVVEQSGPSHLLVSFRSAQHYALRAVECARAIISSLDALSSHAPGSSSIAMSAGPNTLSADDVKYFVTCDVAMSYRFSVSDMTIRQMSSTPSLFRSTPRKTFLSSEALRVIFHIASLQSSTLKSRLVVTDRLAVTLPQRIACSLTPIDLVDIGRSMVSPACSDDPSTAVGGVPPSSLPSQTDVIRMLLYEDPVAERVVRTAFTTRKRETLTAGFQQLLRGDVSGALASMRDMSGDPNSIDVCEWHVFRWRSYASHLDLHGTVAGTEKATEGPSVGRNYIRRLMAPSLS